MGYKALVVLAAILLVSCSVPITSDQEDAQKLMDKGLYGISCVILHFRLYS